MKKVIMIVCTVAALARLSTSALAETVHAKLEGFNVVPAVSQVVEQEPDLLLPHPASRVERVFGHWAVVPLSVGPSPHPPPLKGGGDLGP